MIKRLLFLLLLLPLFALGQFQGGIVVVNGVAVHQPDTSAYKVINTIQQEGTALNGASRFYVTYLVSSTKAIGVWDLIKALYGFVGGTAASHKWNWKDMRDLDGAFRLVFSNIAHDSFGTKANAFNSFSNTFLTANSTNFPGGLISMGVYSSDNLTGSWVDIGARTGGSPATADLALTNGFTTLIAGTAFTSGSNTISATTSSYKGIVISNRTSSSNFSIYKNGQIVVSDLNTRSIVYPNLNIYINSINRAGAAESGSSRRIPFAFIAPQLIDIQAIQASNIVTFAQSILNRQ